jgi:hypothetical protein
MGRLTDMFKTGQILSVGSVLGHSGGNPVSIPCAPRIGGEITPGVANTFLEDFEPVSRSIIRLDIVSRGSGEIHQTRALFVGQQREK